MAEEQDIVANMGMYARHPMRTMGVAFLAGATLGASMMLHKTDKRSNWQKFMDQLSI